MHQAIVIAARGGWWLALVSAGGVLLAPLGYRLGVWDVHFALLTLVKGATIVGLAAFVLCLLAVAGDWGHRQRAGRGYAYVGLLLSLLCAGVPLYHYEKARHVPAIHDITTDTTHPPTFVALAAARAAAPNGLAYEGAAVATAQQQAYPDLVPYLASLPPAALFAQAEAVARALGWEIVATVPQDGRLEATDTSLLFGFADDIVIRISPHARGSQLDIRSMSRVGRSDVGVNAQRIRRFLQQLRIATAGNERYGASPSSTPRLFAFQAHLTTVSWGPAHHTTLVSCVGARHTRERSP
ncbi:MAG TPA: DUF1499 domain-containing protein [Candidatus Tectomicrobia bacterium]|jgi:uncharacterized protein (DUF1499 family)